MRSPISAGQGISNARCAIGLGFIELKTHAKLSMVVRREEGKLVTYCHIGTEQLSSDYRQDLYRSQLLHGPMKKSQWMWARVFNFITGYAEPDHLGSCLVSPYTMRKTLLDYIEREIEHVRAGRPGRIWAKANSLVDPTLIDAFYRASQEGVKIDLVIRGICCLRPQFPGLSDNIRVKSIVGPIP